MTAEQREKNSILIVEDDTDIGTLLKMILENKFPDIDPDRIVHTKSPAEAESLLREDIDPFLIVTTIDMGPYTNMDGKNMIDNWRRSDSPFRDTPILIFSGYDFVDLDWKLPDKTKYLRKPATVEEIEDAVDMAISFLEEEGV